MPDEKSGNWKRLVPLSGDCKYNDKVLAGNLEDFGEGNVVEIECDECGPHDFIECEPNF